MDSENKAVGIGSALIVLVVAAGFYFYKFAAPVHAPAGLSSSGATAENLPSLEGSDATIRGRAAALSSDPAFAAWLKNEDLLPRFAAAANMIAQGKVPKDALAFMAPRGKFVARKSKGGYVASPASYARYDLIAKAIVSIDAAAAAKVFNDLKPLFEAAYRGLGETGDVRDAVVRAAQELLSAPIPASAPSLKEKGIGYAYVDDALERLSSAQKQLLRMGPNNQAAVQAKLRELLSALGVARN
jgi:hypothetical protein